MNTALANVTRQGDTLYFSGALLRETVPALWAAVQPLLPGARQLDLAATCHIDSAGLAMLVELAAQRRLQIQDAPPGLAPLRAAYRLSPELTYTS